MDIAGIPLEPFLQYGFLGIIAFVYIKSTNKLYNNNAKQSELLLNTILNLKTNPDDKLQQTLNLILQTLYNQHTDTNKSVAELLKLIEDNTNEKNEAWELYKKHDSDSRQRIDEMQSILAKIKTLLNEMRSHCGLSHNQKKIGERLVEKGYINLDQLNEVIKEQNGEE